MKRHIVGLDPLNTEYIWQLLFRVDFFFKWLGGPTLRREDGSFTNW